MQAPQHGLPGTQPGASQLQGAVQEAVAGHAAETHTNRQHLHQARRRVRPLNELFL